MKLSKKIKILLWVAITAVNIFAGLPPQTMVFMGNGTYKWAKDLRVGDYIPIYDIPNDRLDSRKRRIQEISTIKTNELIVIKTIEDGCTIVDPDQKLFNCKIKKFVSAEDFEVGDELFSPEKGILTITDIENKELDSGIELYDITLESGNIFLILTTQKTHILVHNMAMAARIGGRIGIRAAISGIGTIASISKGFLTSPVSPGPIKPPDPKDKNKKNNTNNKAKEFEKKISTMSPNERVATVKTETQKVASENGLVKDKRLSRINNRDVYRDKNTDTLYSVDTQHGRFEVLNEKGVHVGEVDLDFNMTKDADLSGTHDLKT